MEGYNRKKVAELLEITPQTVAFYANSGLIKPEVSNPKGRGTRRKYSKGNLLEFLVLRELSSHNIPLRMCKKLMRSMKFKNFDDYINENWKIALTTNNGEYKGIYVFTSKTITDLGFIKDIIKTTEPKSLLIINITHLISMLKRKLDRA